MSRGAGARPPRPKPVWGVQELGGGTRAGCGVGDEAVGAGEKGTPSGWAPPSAGLGVSATGIGGL